MGGSAQSRLLRFGPFVADLRGAQLCRAGRKLKVQEQPFQVLEALLERPGDLVTREELRQRIWPNEFVEFEHSLNVAVSKLREALGDSAEKPHYIETVPRRGYRFIATVQRVKPRPWPRWLAVAVIVLAVAAGVGGIFFRPQQRELRAVPFTSLLGLESEPAISPDGTKVAFCWTGAGEGVRLALAPTDIYVKQVGGEAAVRLTETPEGERSPAWSPDSTRIAFCRKRQGEPGFTIHIMEAVGGPDRQVGESYLGCGLAWSPDGQFLAVAGAESPKALRGIYSLSIETHKKRTLTTPPSGFAGDSVPAFSPDGRSLAFIRSRSLLADDVYRLALTGDGVRDGEPQRVTPRSQFWMQGLDWTADGRGIVYATGDGGLWRIPVSGGDPQRLSVGHSVGQLSVSRKGDRLVHVKRDMVANLFQVPGPNAAPAESRGKPNSPERPFSSTAWDTSPKYSPDGKRIVFVSDRGGLYRIWRCASNGLDCVRLTTVPGLLPRWSPDGRLVAFTSCADEDWGNFDIFVVSAEGGESLRLTVDAAFDTHASWSKDGRWIYFGSDRSGDWQIWKKPFEGGDAEQVTRNGGSDGYESVDGFLYYTKAHPARGIWRIPIEGGEEIQVIEHGEETYWELLDDGICFRTNPPEGRVVKFFRFSTRQTETVWKAPEDSVFNGFAVSPDGQWVLCALVERFESDLMLVENFR